MIALSVGSPEDDIYSKATTEGADLHRTWPSIRPQAWCQQGPTIDHISYFVIEQNITSTEKSSRSIDLGFIPKAVA